MFHGELPDAAQLAAFKAETAALRTLPAAVRDVLPALAHAGALSGPLAGLRTALSLLGATVGFRPLYDIDAGHRRADALAACAAVPTLITALHRLGQGLPPIEPRADLGHAANYLYMLTGAEPEPEQVRAIEAYLISTIDHGFNASTFTARVITSTGADLGACLVGAVGALSGPLHGGAPSRALDMLDAIGTLDRIDSWIRDSVQRGDRIMGFGHSVYRTEDPRSRMLRGIAERFGGPLVEFAVQVEARVEELLAELKPGRELHINVELYAGVVMELCGLPREMFTPTFCAARVVGWSANILEQAQDSKIIRPAARYVGPPSPQPVPVVAPR
jgi:citrate synthase